MNIIKLSSSVVMILLSFYLVDLGFKYPTMYQVPIHFVSMILFSYGFVYLFTVGRDHLVTKEKDDAVA